MDAKNFPKDLQHKADMIRDYANNTFPRMAGAKILRFIDGNFRAQGWQGSTFQRWQPNKRKGTILIKTSRLRNSISQSFGPREVVTFTSVPYAGVHNRGFSGTVSIPAHTRTKYAAVQVGTGQYTNHGTERTKTMHKATGSTQVKSHQRKMNIPKRQFMPEKYNDSPVLINSIKREVINTLKTIFH